MTKLSQAVGEIVADFSGLPMTVQAALYRGAYLQERAIRVELQRQLAEAQFAAEAEKIPFVDPHAPQDTLTRAEKIHRLRDVQRELASLIESLS